MGKTHGQTCRVSAATSRQGTLTEVEATANLFYQTVLLSSGEEQADSFIADIEQDGVIDKRRLQNRVEDLDKANSWGKAEKIAQMAEIFSPGLDQKKFLSEMKKAQKDFPTREDFENYFVAEITRSDSFAPHLEETRKEMLAENPDVSEDEVYQRALIRAKNDVYHGHWEYNDDQPGVPPPEIWLPEQIREKTADIFEQCGGEREIISNPSYFSRDPFILAKASKPDLFTFTPGELGVGPLSYRRSGLFFIEPDGRITGNVRDYRADLGGEEEEVEVIEQRTSDGRSLQISWDNEHNDWQDEQSQPTRVTIAQSATNGQISYKIASQSKPAEEGAVPLKANTKQVEQAGGLEAWGLNLLNQLVAADKKAAAERAEREANDPDKQINRLLDF